MPSYEMVVGGSNYWISLETGIDDDGNGCYVVRFSKDGGPIFTLTPSAYRRLYAKVIDDLEENDSRLRVLRSRISRLKDERKEIVHALNVANDFRVLFDRIEDQDERFRKNSEFVPCSYDPEGFGFSQFDQNAKLHDSCGDSMRKRTTIEKTENVDESEEMPCKTDEPEKGSIEKDTPSTSGGSESTEEEKSEHSEGKSTRKIIVCASPELSDVIEKIVPELDEVFDRLGF